MAEPVVLVENPAPRVGLVRINRPDARHLHAWSAFICETRRANHALARTPFTEGPAAPFLR